LIGFKKGVSALLIPDKHKTIPEEAVLQLPQGSGLILAGLDAGAGQRKASLNKIFLSQLYFL